MTPLTPDEIKSIRSQYGLSQKSFATLLGIGEATMARYELGTTAPSKAHAKLIRLAGNDPKFMMQCLAEDGDLIPQRQYQSTERYVYAVVSLDPEETLAETAAARVNRMYEITLRQEVLNEQAANIACDIMRAMTEQGIDFDAEEHFLVKLLKQLYSVKKTIVSYETESIDELNAIAGYLSHLEALVKDFASADEVA